MIIFPIRFEGFIVYSDVSKKKLGCVLMQQESNCICIKQLKSHEVNYPVYDLELAIVMFTLRVWKYYLYGSQLQIFTHYKSLRYLMS
jgi:hypothetical protein